MNVMWCSKGLTLSYYIHQIVSKNISCQLAYVGQLPVQDYLTVSPFPLLSMIFYICTITYNKSTDILQRLQLILWNYHQLDAFTYYNDVGIGVAPQCIIHLRISLHQQTVKRKEQNKAI